MSKRCHNGEPRPACAGGSVLQLTDVAGQLGVSALETAVDTAGVMLCCAAGSASSAALITHAAEDATVLNPLRSQVVLEETAADESPTGSSDCSMLPMISSTVVEKSSAIKVMGVDGEHQLGQQISSRDQIFLLIDDFRPAVVSSISWDFSARGTFVKSVPSCLRGNLRPGDELFAIGAVVVQKLSRDIIDRRLAEVMVPNHVLPGLVELVFLQSMNDGSVGSEPKFALVGPEHAMPVKAMQAEDPFAVGKRTNFESESVPMKRSASNESGAAAKKLRCGDGVEGQRRIGYSTCYDPRLDPEAWHEVFRGGQWVRLERVERNMKGQEGSGRYRKAQESSGRA